MPAQRLRHGGASNPGVDTAATREPLLPAGSAASAVAVQPAGDSGRKAARGELWVQVSSAINNTRTLSR